LFIILKFSALAQIESIGITLVPPNLALTGSFADIQWTVKQDDNTSTFDLTFFREGPADCGVNQSLIANISAPPSGEISGPHVVALCDGDRVLNKIFVIGRETDDGILVPGSPTLEIISDTVPPDPPNLDDASNDFPKTIFTSTFQITGNVDNSQPPGNATDKPETAGSVTVFFAGDPDPVTGETTRVVLGGGLIQPNARYIATVDVTSLNIGQTVSLQMVAADSLGQESAVRTLGDITRGSGGDVRLENLTIAPNDGSITNNTGVLISGQVIGTVAPFAVKIYQDGNLNSEIGGLASGDNFSHTLNMTTEGIHCFEVEPENSNTPIFKAGRTRVGCITLDLTAPNAPQIIEPNPGSTLITRGPTFQIRGLTEPDQISSNTLKPRVFLDGPSGINFSPVSPIEIATGGNLNIAVDIQDLPDGQHTVELRATDEVGNSDPGAVSRVTFIKDTVAPIVEEIRVNEVVVPQVNPPLFIPSSSVRLKIRLNEDATTAPRLIVRPNNAGQFNAGLFEGSGKNWTYSFAVTPGMDGPLSVTVEGGTDRAGNPINFTADGIVQVDTRAPNVKEMVPKERSVLSKTPSQFRLIFEDLGLGQNDPVSGVDTQSANIQIFDPAGARVDINLVQFDPITVDVIPLQQFTLEGDYRIEIVISDKAGNQSTKDTRLFTMDFTAVSPDEITCVPEHNGFARFGVSPFNSDGTHFVQVRVSNQQFDEETSTLVLKNFQEIPQLLPGVKKVVDEFTIQYDLNTPLPSDTSKDGKYVIESQIYDDPGNHLQDQICVFTYDNCPPSVQSVFPSTGTAVGRNLRTVSAVLKDCLPRFDVEISDIDLENSSIQLFRITEDGAEVEIRSRVRFQTVPDQRAQKVLLEIIDSSGATTSLPNDGSGDGRYKVQVQAVDRSGNQSPMSSTTFILDTQDPILVPSNLSNDQVLAGGEYFFFGQVRDNAGGSGMEKVEIAVHGVQGTVPTTTLLNFTEVALNGAPIPPTQFTPPFRDWSYNLKLNAQEDTPAIITLRTHDKAGNTRDFEYRVLIKGKAFDMPEKSQPVNNSSTNQFFVNFDWVPVKDAKEYELEIITPNQNKKHFRTPLTELTVNLASLAEGEGLYGWNLRAVDSLGNKGLQTLNTNFTIDQTKPRVTSIQIQDPSPESQGRITQGVTRLIFTFSEKMDINTVPKVHLQSIANARLDPIPMKVISYLEDRLVAQVTLDPPQLSKDNVFGFVRATVSGARDMATNPMQPVDSGLNLFEVYTGPYFDVRFFSNPVDPDSITFILKGFVAPGFRAQEIPDIPSVVVLDNENQEFALEPVRVTAQTFAVSLHLSRVRRRSFHLRISGEDPFGNNNTRQILFKMTDLFPTQKVQLSLGKVNFDIPEGAVKSQKSLMIVPAGSQEENAVEGLEVVDYLDSFHHWTPLDKGASAQGSYPGTSTKGLAVYVKSEKGWEYLPTRWHGKNFTSNMKALGQLALMRDQLAPEIEILQEKSNELEFQVTEKGSGIDPEQSYFETQSKDYPVELEEAGLVRVKIEGAMSGEGNLILQDRAGNKSISKAVAFVGNQNPQGDVSIYPNPVKNRMNYQLHTNFIPQSAEMYVYDAAGRRVYSEEIAQTLQRQSFEWGLHTESGLEVANGVYFLRIKWTHPGGIVRKTRKFAVIQP